MNQVRLLVDWKGLKALGWPYSRVHTWRLMSEGRFPRAHKLGRHRNSHPVWKLTDILKAFETYGLVFTDADISP
jgi:predicted DNA-binding transcriptional regulator AlpA